VTIGPCGSMVILVYLAVLSLHVHNNHVMDITIEFILKDRSRKHIHTNIFEKLKSIRSVAEVHQEFSRSPIGPVRECKSQHFFLAHSMAGYP
jgi:hypothetical protein